MPNLLKFLMMFGPGEFRFCIPRRKPRLFENVEVVERHQIGNLVFRRKTWTFDVPGLQTSVASLSDSPSFLEINNWRLRCGIPDQVFLIEPLAEGPVQRAQRKPQYIDFTSPGFVEIFRAVIEMNVPKLSMAEVLPHHGDFPVASDGSRWGVELQLDCFGFPSWTENLLVAGGAS
jgi:hypothetical protein